MISFELFSIIFPALVIGIVISLTHAPLGIEVLKRGIIFIDLSIAQIVALVIILLKVYLHKLNYYVFQIVLLLSAIATSYIFYIIEKISPKRQEALIGVSYILSASIAVIIMAENPHGGDEIQKSLTGDLLFVTFKDILKHALIYATIIYLWFAKKVIREGIGFYILFAFAITSSVQLVGVYVVFASLILPAIAAYNYKNKHLIAYICGISSVATGIIFSTITDLPTGPLLVICYCIIAGFINFIPHVFIPSSKKN